MMSGVWENYAEAAFRTSPVRNHLKLDTNPTEQAVLSFHKHLLAEAEALATGSKARSTTSTTTTLESAKAAPEKPPKIKGLQAI